MVCDVLSMLCINCNNVSVLCLHVIVTDSVLTGEIAGNKHNLLLLFKYLGATLTKNGDLDAEMAHTIQSEWKKNWKRGYWVFCVVEE